jgi:hypothetical protein
MEFEVLKIVLAEEAHPPKVEVHLYFREEVKYCARKCDIRVYLDWKDYTISEMKAEAIKKAKEFLSQS